MDRKAGSVDRHHGVMKNERACLTGSGRRPVSARLRAASAARPALCCRALLLSAGEGFPTPPARNCGVQKASGRKARRGRQCCPGTGVCDGRCGPQVTGTRGSVAAAARSDFTRETRELDESPDPFSSLPSVLCRMNPERHSALGRRGSQNKGIACICKCQGGGNPSQTGINTKYGN